MCMTTTGKWVKVAGVDKFSNKSNGTYRYHYSGLVLVAFYSWQRLRISNKQRPTNIHVGYMLRVFSLVNRYYIFTEGKGKCRCNKSILVKLPQQNLLLRYIITVLQKKWMKILVERNRKRRVESLPPYLSWLQETYCVTSCIWQRKRPYAYNYIECGKVFLENLYVRQCRWTNALTMLSLLSVEKTSQVPCS